MALKVDYGLPICAWCDESRVGAEGVYSGQSRREHQSVAESLEDAESGMKTVVASVRVSFPLVCVPRLSLSIDTVRHPS